MTIITLLLAGILLLLGATVVLLILLYRKDSSNEANFTITPKLDEIVKQIDQAFHKNMEVSAIIEMIKQIEDSPDALERLKSFPAATYTATQIYLISGLSNNLRESIDYLCNLNNTSLGSPLGAAAFDIALRRVVVNHDALANAVSATENNGLLIANETAMHAGQHMASDRGTGTPGKRALRTV